MKTGRWLHGLCAIAGLLFFYTGSSAAADEMPRFSNNMVQIPGDSNAQQTSVLSPDWAGHIKYSPAMKPPFKKTLSANDMMQIKPVPGFYIKISGHNISKEKGILISAAFKGNRPIKDPAAGTISLSPDQSDAGTTHKETPAEADSIVVRVGRGRITVKAELIAISDGIKRPEKTIPAAPGLDQTKQPVKKTAKAKPGPSLPENKKGIHGGEIPHYANAKITKSVSDGKKNLVNMETDDSPEKVMNFYKANLTGKGWRVKMAMAKGKVASLSMYKDKQGFLLSAGQRSGKTEIMLMFTK